MHSPTSARGRADDMPNMTLTRQMAYDAGRDAGNRSMRHAGRSAWSEADWNVAAEEHERLIEASARADHASATDA